MPDRDGHGYGSIAVVTIPEPGDATADDGDAPNDEGGLAGVLAVLRRRPALLAVYLLFFGANALLCSIVVFYAIGSRGMRPPWSASHSSPGSSSRAA